MSSFVNDKDCRILLDWLLSHDILSARDIKKHLIFMGFDSPSILASSYAFFISEYQNLRNNENFQRCLVALQSMIIDKFMELYDFNSSFDSSGFFCYSSSSAQDFE